MNYDLIFILPPSVFEPQSLARKACPTMIRHTCIKCVCKVEGGWGNESAKRLAFAAALLWRFVALIVLSWVTPCSPWAQIKPSRRRECGKGCWRGGFFVICMGIVVVARTASATRCDSVIPGLAVGTTSIDGNTCNEGTATACKNKIAKLSIHDHIRRNVINQLLS